ncbi:hypothetical protein BDK51DRAFT_26040 [Blyttiomyces helicus]|uniref:Uncharacterized protein n=1 Tax=Blyttiomyces helicus TaxID=388810 RepID=A0A4P9WHP1_9FUNG|nr:hypothetical protein BDK51DRAFT_26040 [Blyttiomyces helicus]|eukprot:RKO90630.1 hypothetical protein BDK51DRAFT_26040 [Blyttiomyces helicus]
MRGVCAVAMMGRWDGDRGDALGTDDWGMGKNQFCPLLVGAHTRVVKPLRGSSVVRHADPVLQPAREAVPEIRRVPVAIAALVTSDAAKAVKAASTPSESPNTGARGAPRAGSRTRSDPGPRSCRPCILSGDDTQSHAPASAPSRVLDAKPTLAPVSPSSFTAASDLTTAPAPTPSDASRAVSHTPLDSGPRSRRSGSLSDDKYPLAPASVPSYVLDAPHGRVGLDHHTHPVPCTPSVLRTRIDPGPRTRHPGIVDGEAGRAPEPASVPSAACCTCACTHRPNAPSNPPITALPLKIYASPPLTTYTTPTFTVGRQVPGAVTTATFQLVPVKPRADLAVPVWPAEKLRPMTGPPVCVAPPVIILAIAVATSEEMDWMATGPLKVVSPLPVAIAPPVAAAAAPIAMPLPAPHFSAAAAAIAPPLPPNFVAPPAVISRFGGAADFGSGGGMVAGGGISAARGTRDKRLARKQVDRDRDERVERRRELKGKGVAGASSAAAPATPSAVVAPIASASSVVTPTWPVPVMWPMSRVLFPVYLGFPPPPASTSAMPATPASTSTTLATPASAFGVKCSNPLQSLRPTFAPPPRCTGAFLPPLTFIRLASAAEEDDDDNDRPPPPPEKRQACSDDDEEIYSKRRSSPPASSSSSSSGTEAKRRTSGPKPFCSFFQQLPCRKALGREK